MSSSELLTVGKAAELLMESRSKTMRRLRRGELPFEKLDGDLGAHLVRRADVEAIRRTIVAELEAKVESMKAVAS